MLTHSLDHSRLGTIVIETTNPNIDQAMIERVLTSHKMISWLDGMDPKMGLVGIKIRDVVMFGPERVGRVLFDMVCEPDGVRSAFDKTVCLWGAAVHALIVLRCEGQEFVIFTEQKRECVGRMNLLELPAGLCDDEENSLDVMVREIEEETGITARPEALINLSRMAYGQTFPGVYLSAGGTDEYTILYLLQTVATREEVNAINGRKTGLAAEGENITLRVIPISEAPFRSPDAGSLSALFFYQIFKDQRLEKQLI